MTSAHRSRLHRSRGVRRHNQHSPQRSVLASMFTAGAVVLPLALLLGGVSSMQAAAQPDAGSSWPSNFRGQVTGDAALVSEAEDALEPGYRHNMSVAKLEGDEVTFGGVGADEHTEFEIGSITKTFTAGLFADAVDRGEVAPTTTLGEVWPDLDGKVAEISLDAIAAQRSGLPRMPPAPEDPVDRAKYEASPYLPADPYQWSDDDIVESLHTVTVGEQQPEYSNYGFAVLGQALSAVTDQSYADLVHDRITEPLGLDDTYVPESAEGLSHGWVAPGVASDPWTLEGSAPAGAIRSTAHDISVWVKAVRDSEAPGSEAAMPREPYDEGNSIGWAWETTKGEAPEVTWKNGGTGGYRSFAGFSAGSGEGVVVLSDTPTSVDSAIGLIS